MNQSNNEAVQRIVNIINSKIDNAPEKQLKDDMKFLIVTAIKQVEQLDVRLLDFNIDKHEMKKIFLHIGKDLIADMLNPFLKDSLEKKFSIIKELGPVLKKYSNE